MNNFMTLQNYLLFNERDVSNIKGENDCLVAVLYVGRADVAGTLNHAFDYLLLKDMNENVAKFNLCLGCPLIN